MGRRRRSGGVSGKPSMNLEERRGVCEDGGLDMAGGWICDVSICVY